MTLAKPTYVEFPLTSESTENLRLYLEKDLNLPEPLWGNHFHSTTVFSREPITYTPIDLYKEAYSTNEYPPHNFLLLDGGKGLGLCLALEVYCKALVFSHRKGIQAGASWDFPTFIPHITLAYGIQVEDLIGKSLKVPGFPLAFEREKVLDLDEDWKPIRPIEEG